MCPPSGTWPYNIVFFSAEVHTYHLPYVHLSLHPLPLFNASHKASLTGLLRHWDIGTSSTSLTVGFNADPSYSVYFIALCLHICGVVAASDHSILRSHAVILTTLSSQLEFSTLNIVSQPITPKSCEFPLPQLFSPLSASSPPRPTQLPHCKPQAWIWPDHRTLQTSSQWIRKQSSSSCNNSFNNAAHFRL